jgi:hypothetical protein
MRVAVMHSMSTDSASSSTILSDWNTDSLSAAAGAATFVRLAKIFAGELMVCHVVTTEYSERIKRN